MSHLRRPTATGRYVPASQRWMVLTGDEVRVLAEIERLFHCESDEPPAQPLISVRCVACATRHRWASIAVTVAAWAALVLAAFGAAISGAALAAVTVSSWWVWCTRGQPGDVDVQPS
jgi:hypothetical protein